MLNYERAHNGQLPFVEPRAHSLTDAPSALAALLESNRLFSARFVSEAERRRRWFSQHRFRPFLRICSDGRCLCLEQALGEDRLHFEGIPSGVFEADRSIGAISALDSGMSCMITEDRLRKCHGWGMKALSLEFAHVSSRHPDSSSCAALHNDTSAAIEIVRHNANETNCAYDGRGVSIPALLDTDTYAITAFGPCGRSLNTLETAMNRDIRTRRHIAAHFRSLLRKTLPDDWQPLKRMGHEVRRAFYQELANLLMYNVLWVRHVARSGWQIKMDRHEERLLAVGRHIAPLAEPNTVFYVADHCSHKARNFETGLRFVTQNAIADAVAANAKTWRATILINLPFDDSPRLQQINVRHMRDRLMAIAADSQPRIAEQIASSFGHLPAWAKEQLGRADAFLGNIYWAMSVSRRSDRLLMPFE